MQLRKRYRPIGEISAALIPFVGLVGVGAVHSGGLLVAGALVAGWGPGRYFRACSVRACGKGVACVCVRCLLSFFGRIVLASIFH